MIDNSNVVVNNDEHLFRLFDCKIELKYNKIPGDLIRTDAFDIRFLLTSMSINMSLTRACVSINGDPSIKLGATNEGNCCSPCVGRLIGQLVYVPSSFNALKYQLR